MMLFYLASTSSRLKNYTSNMVSVLDLSHLCSFQLEEGLLLRLMLPGPIIRINPREIHISDANFLDTVYAPSLVQRDKDEYQLRTLRVPTSIRGTVNHNLHKRRREALNPFFSKRNVLNLETVIVRKIDQLCRVIESHSHEETVVNLSDVFFAFANE